MLSLMPRFTTSLFNDMDHFFDDTWEPFQESPSENPMKTDIQVKDGLYLLKMDMPGFDKNDIKVELNNGYLTVSAQKNDENEKKDESGYVMRERYSGSCSRSFYVGSDVTEDDIKAAFKDGTLCMSLPTGETQQPENHKYIPIEAA